jgi:hypothetical protein
MEKTNKTEGKTSTESVGVTETQVVSIITPVGSSDFTIPIDFPKAIYLDCFGKSYKITPEGIKEVTA